MEKIYRHLRTGIMVLVMVQFSQYAYATGVRMTWEKNPEDNVAGYKVYYGTSSGQYDHSIDVGNVTAVDIGDLENTTYYFAMTAYNTEGAESTYSEEISAEIGPNGQGTVLPPAGDTSADTSGSTASDSAAKSGGGGGGGGGCFVSASSIGMNPFLALLALFCTGFMYSRRRHG